MQISFPCITTQGTSLPPKLQSHRICRGHSATAVSQGKLSPKILSTALRQVVMYYQRKASSEGGECVQRGQPEWAKLSAHNRKYEAVLETAPKTNSIECII